MIVACGDKDSGSSSSDSASSGNAADVSIEEQKRELERDASNGWTLDVKAEFFVGCTNAAGEYSSAFMSTYCSCMLEFIIPLYTPDYFVIHSATIMQKLRSNGTIDSCISKAESITGEQR